jgi:hypothetical protein
MFMAHARYVVVGLALICDDCHAAAADCDSDGTD